MANTWDERGKSIEEGYFRQKDNELIEKMRGKISAESTTEAYNCPKCTGKLLSGNFEKIQIDICDTCGGVWLDAGELQQITHKDDHGFFNRLFN